MVSERTKGRINLYIELEKQKLDRIYASNVRTSLDKCIISEEKRTRTNIISMIRVYILYFHAVLIKRPGGPASQYMMRTSKQHVHGKCHILSLESKFLETYLALEMSLNNAPTHGKLQGCQTRQSDMPIAAETMQSYDL